MIATTATTHRRPLKIWQLVKHTWMAAKHRDAETLEADVSEILDNVGSRYNLAF